MQKKMVRQKRQEEMGKQKPADRKRTYHRFAVQNKLSQENASDYDSQASKQQEQCGSWQQQWIFMARAFGMLMK